MRIRIPSCHSRELSLREYLMSQLCSIRHDIPVILPIPGAYGQCLTTMVTSSWWFSGQDLGLFSFGMTTSKSGDYKLISSGQALEFLWWPLVLVSQDRDLCHVQLHPT